MTGAIANDEKVNEQTKYCWNRNAQKKQRSVPYYNLQCWYGCSGAEYQCLEWYWCKCVFNNESTVLGKIERYRQHWHHWVDICQVKGLNGINNDMYDTIKGIDHKKDTCPVDPRTQRIDSNMILVTMWHLLHTVNKKHTVNNDCLISHSQILLDDCFFPSHNKNQYLRRGAHAHHDVSTQQKMLFEYMLHHREMHFCMPLNLPVLVLFVCASVYYQLMPVVTVEIPTNW